MSCDPYPCWSGGQTTYYYTWTAYTNERTPNGLPYFIDKTDVFEGGEVSYSIDWGDGTPESSGTIISDQYFLCDTNPNRWGRIYQITVNYAEFIGDNQYDNGVLNRRHTYTTSGIYELVYSVPSLGLICYVTVTVHGPKLQYNGNDTGPFTDVIGNKFVVTPVTKQGKTISSMDWSIQNTTNNVADAITNQVVTKQSGFQNTYFGTNGVLNGAAASAITAYWGPYGGQEVINATFHYTSGNPDSISINVNVLVPTGSMNPINFGTPSVTDHDNSLWVSSGKDKNLDPGFSWSSNVDPNTTNGINGNQAVVQILGVINTKTIYNTYLGNYYVREFFKNANGSNNWPLLDDKAETSNVFYGGDIGTTGNDLFNGDTPATPVYPAEFLWSGDVFARDYTLFDQTLMFQPTSGVNGAGIYVPLGIQFWSWEGVWQASQPNKLVSSVKPHIAVPYKRTTNYPSWNGLGSTYTDVNALIYWEHKL